MYIKKMLKFTEAEKQKTNKCRVLSLSWIGRGKMSVCSNL